MREQPCDFRRRHCNRGRERGRVSCGLAAFCSDRDYYLPDLGVRFHVAVGIDDLREWEDLADAGLEGAFGKIVEDVLLRFAELLWKFIWIRNHFEEGISLDGQVLAQGGKERVGGRISDQDAVLKNDSAGSSGRGQGFDRFTSD